MSEDLLNDFEELPEADENGIEGVEGVLSTLYPAKDGKFGSQQSGYIEDEDGNKAFITFNKMCLDESEWEGEYVKIVSKYNKQYDKYTGVKIKDPNGKGDQIWVTSTAAVFDEAGDEVPVSDTGASKQETGRRGSKAKGSSGRAKKPARQERPSRKPAGRSKPSSQDGEAVDVFQLTEDICNVQKHAFDYLTDKGIGADEAAPMAAMVPNALAVWWFGKDPDKMPLGIEQLRETKKTRKKTTRKRKEVADEDLDFEEEEDEDGIPY